MEMQLVVFRLANEFFGIDIASVESIVKMQDITRLPQTPDFLEGIINLRGKILPVVDLRKRLNLPAMEKTLESRIVITSFSAATIGLIVDNVEEVIDIDDNLIEPPPSITSSVNTEFIRGIAKTGQMLIILLDLEKVLQSKAAIQAAALQI
jgi:purine-binding chemotaxis protein CheW